MVQVWVLPALIACSTALTIPASKRANQVAPTGKQEPAVLLAVKKPEGGIPYSANYRIGCICANALGVGFMALLLHVSNTAVSSAKLPQSAAEAGSASKSTPPMERDALLDNAKFLAISSVVLQHFAPATEKWHWFGFNTVTVFNNFNMPFHCFALSVGWLPRSPFPGRASTARYLA